MTSNGIPACFAYSKKRLHMLVGILSNIVIAPGHNFQAGILKLCSAFLQFLLRKIIGQVM